MAKQVPTTTVDLDALLETARRGVPGNGCTLGAFLATLDPTVRGKLEAALDDPDYSGAGLAPVFQALGFRYSSAPIERHRRKACRCRQ